MKPPDIPGAAKFDIPFDAVARDLATPLFITATLRAIDRYPGAETPPPMWLEAMTEDRHARRDLASVDR